VIPITKKALDKHLETSLILSILKQNKKNPKELNNYNLSLRLKRYLACLTTRRMAKMLYVLHLIRISTSTELRNMLNLPSIDSIAYYSIKTGNAGLIQTITQKERNYNKFHKFWRGVYPNTHKNTRFYTPTKELDQIIPYFEDFFNSLFTEDQVARFKERGNQFQKHMKKEQKEEQEEERTRESVAQMTIGACSKCGITLTIDDQKRKNIRTYENKPYCKNCYMLLLNEGVISKHLKNVRKNS